MLAFNFTGANSTNDSNVVVDQGKDVLSQAQGAIFTINTVPGASSSPATNSTTSNDDSSNDTTDTTGEVAGGTTTTNVDIVVPPPSGQVLAFPEASSTLALMNEPNSGTQPPGKAQPVTSAAPESNPFAKNQQLGLILLLVGLVFTYIVIRLVRAYIKRKDESLAADVSA